MNSRKSQGEEPNAADQEHAFGELRRVRQGARRRQVRLLLVRERTGGRRGRGRRWGRRRRRADVPFSDGGLAELPLELGPADPQRAGREQCFSSAAQAATRRASSRSFHALKKSAWPE
jgi:hypothetical protein